MGRVVGAARMHVKVLDFFDAETLRRGGMRGDSFVVQVHGLERECAEETERRRDGLARWDARDASRSAGREGYAT